ncbi:hypothetical protein T484DRAFT_1900468, partial [Baffinella frigidus]
MVQVMNDYQVAVESAKAEYKWLQDKFPGSASVIMAAAHFTDTVLNDIGTAQKLRHQAAVIENDPGIEMEDEMVNKKDDRDGASSVSSDNDARSNTARFMDSWRHEIVGEEFRTLVTLQQRVKLTVLLILTLSTVGFVFTDSVLFSTRAKTNLEHMDLVGAFRSQVLTSAYLLRSQMLAAHHGHDHDVTQFEDEILANMDKLTEEHILENMDKLTTQHVHSFDTATSGQVAQVDQTYWTFGNDFARKTRLASSTPMAELADSNFKLTDISEAKRAIVYVQET